MRETTWLTLRPGDQSGVVKDLESESLQDTVAEPVLVVDDLGEEVIGRPVAQGRGKAARTHSIPVR